jgi:hypothetical protein
MRLYCNKDALVSELLVRALSCSLSEHRIQQTPENTLQRGVDDEMML